MNCSKLNRREFFEVAGAGLMVVASEPLAEAQRGGGGGGGTLEARLHIGEDGFITILTGKVEEGQGGRTELALAAAEELRVPLERVRMEMADTDRTPNDGTTAGSGTTPRTIPLVRRAAAAATRGCRNTWFRTILRGGIRPSQAAAAMPLLFQLREDQKQEVRTLARLIGLEKVAAQI